VKPLAKLVEDRKKHNPCIIILHPEGLEIGNLLSSGAIRAVCSECQEELEPGGFGEGVVLHWTCGCVIPQKAEHA
jgi:hypothetical protein